MQSFPRQSPAFELVAAGRRPNRVCEGARARTRNPQLYATLVRDAGHNDVALLDYAEISERRFSSWRMGRVDLDKLNLGVVLKYSEMPQLDPFQMSGRVALAFVEELMSTASIMGGS